MLFFCIRLTTVYHIDEVYFETFVEQEDQQQQAKTVEQIALAYLDAKIKGTQYSKIRKRLQLQMCLRVVALVNKLSKVQTKKTSEIK